MAAYPPRLNPFFLDIRLPAFGADKDAFNIVHFSDFLHTIRPPRLPENRIGYGGIARQARLPAAPALTRTWGIDRIRPVQKRWVMTSSLAALTVLASPARADDG